MSEKLKLHCDVISGYAFSSSDWKEEGIPVIKIGNISNGSDIDCDELQYVDEFFLDKLDPKYHISNGDILVSLTGSHINQPNSMVGRSCRSLTEKKYLLNQRAGKVIPFDNTDKNYLYYLLSTKAIKYDIANRAYGGANQVNVSPSDIKNIKWEFPLIEKQRKISGILSKYDELIQNNNKRIIQLEGVAQELYKEWFVRFRFPGYENVKFEDGLPKGWTIKRLADYGRVETGKTPSTNVLENYGGEMMFVKTPDMHGNIFIIQTEDKLSERGHNTQPKKLLPANSSMVSCIGTAGVVSINARPAHTNQQINSIILNNPNELEWLHHTCKSLKETIELFGATGATMTNLSKGKFEKLKVVDPGEDLILAYHNKVKPLFDEIKSLMYQNQNLAAQRDMLLPRLMSGKLEV